MQFKIFFFFLPLFSFAQVRLVTLPDQEYIAQPSAIKFYYKHNGKPIYWLDSLQRINPKIKFATNGQMFKEHTYAPVGLYIENSVQYSKMVKVKNKTNFGIQPQSIFAITKDNKAVLVPIDKAVTANYKYATELSPMLVINGQINPQLPTSKSALPRSGIGILKDGRVYFLVANHNITFRKFAQLFIDKGCTNAAFVDGNVSEAWTPTTKNVYGQFGVMIAVE